MSRAKKTDKKGAPKMLQISFSKFSLNNQGPFEKPAYFLRKKFSTY